MRRGGESTTILDGGASSPAGFQTAGIMLAQGSRSLPRPNSASLVEGRKPLLKGRLQGAAMHPAQWAKWNS